jgi:hypothetical protein
MRRKKSSLPIMLDLFDESNSLLILRGDTDKERSTLFLPILGNDEALDGVFYLAKLVEEFVSS